MEIARPDRQTVKDSPAPGLGLRRAQRSGLAQLSVVEHALCPLDDRLSLVKPLVFDTGYFRTNANGHAKFIPVQIRAQEGLSANDEFYLWGLLALAFKEKQPSLEFWATPHFCLRRLGCLPSKGGANYAQFREALRRLAGTTYYCDCFYDPLRAEERRRAFGFLKYDLPARDDSSRAWRLVWDPLFFEYCQALGGRMSFDLATYRQLDCASRRLFLLLSKIFWRTARSPRFDVWHLAVHVLGFSPSVKMYDLKIKLLRSVGKLLALGVLRLPPAVSSPKALFEKKGTGSYAIRFARGPYFEQSPESLGQNSQPLLSDSPLYEPLRAIGFSDRRIRFLLQTYKPTLLQTWADVTLAKLERDGRESFTNCPEAYFLNNLKAAAEGRRTPPDWYHELRREQARKQSEANRMPLPTELYREAWEQARAAAFRSYLKEEVGRDVYEAAVTKLTAIYAATMPQHAAVEAALREAERHFLAGFTFPDLANWALQNCTGLPSPESQESPT